MEKILIADDNKQNCSILRDVVESWGYQVSLAYSGDEAISLAKKLKPQIILLDVMMPGLNGYEVCEQLRKKNGSDAFIVLVTALSEVEDRILGYNVGADIFLSKPVNYHELQAILKRRLEEKRGSEDKEDPQNLLAFFTYIFPKSKVDAKLLSRVVEYGKRLGRELKFSALDVQRLTMALGVQNLDLEITVEKKELDLRKGLSLLKMGDWLLTILEYSQAQERSTENIQVEDVFLLLKTYARLHKIHKGQQNLIVEALWGEALAGKCSKELVDRLAVILRNERLLANLDD